MVDIQDAFDRLFFENINYLHHMRGVEKKRCFTCPVTIPESLNNNSDPRWHAYIGQVSLVW